MKSVCLLKSRLNFRGGLEKYTRRLADAFAKAGCNVTVLTTDSGDLQHSPHYEVISLGRTSKFSLRHIVTFNAKCQQWLSSHPQDIVFGLERTTKQTHYRAGSGVHAVFLQQRKKIEPWISQWMHQLNPLHRTLLHYERVAFESNALRCLFTNSWMVRQEILEHFSVPPEKIEVVHNGVEWKEWEVPFHNSFSPLNPSSKGHRFLFVGNGYRRKGLHFLLEGLTCFPKEAFFLRVIGKDKELSTFQHLAEQLGIASSVEFLGLQTSLLPHYQWADTLVIPSIYDPFANVTVEALAMGLYVVSSSFNGGKEILTEQNGIVIEDLFLKESVADRLKKAFDNPKTPEMALKRRNSIQELDFSRQLNMIVKKTLSN